MLGATALTLQLALILGLYFSSAGLAALLRPGLWRSVTSELKASPTLCNFGGVIAFVIGAVLVMLHNRWTGPLPGLISFLGWAALVKGLLLTAVPSSLLAITDRALRFERLIALLIFALGISLILLGIFAGTDPYYDTLREMA